MEGDSRCYYSSNNWDLHAVVRFARGGSRAPPAPSADDPFSFLPAAATDEGLPDAGWQPLPDLPSRDDPAVVDDLFRAFFVPSSPPPPQPQQQQQQPAAAPTNEGTTPQQTKASSGGGGARSRRKKKQVKKAVQRVPADCVSADPWAWRKYGQKPIKGSPYPRGYYRCSSDKECKARKMVERCSTDPDTFVLTYTGDHSHPVPVHRNSLAGTTRHNQLPSPKPGAVGEQHAPPEGAAEPCPAPSAWPGLSPATPLHSPSVEYGQEEEEEEFDEAGARMLMEEDVEVAGGDELALPFLKPDEPAIEVGGDSTVDGGAGTAPIVNIVEETFVFTPWVTAAGDALFAADGGWR